MLDHNDLSAVATMINYREKLLHVGRQLIFSCREICLGTDHKRASLLLIGQSLELLLKSELAPNQVSESKLRDKFGHDIKKMLNTKECSELKLLMEKHAEGWALDLKERGMDGLSTTELLIKDFWDQIDLLSCAHSSVSDYALRYPHDPIKVPIPILPYLVVQNCIWDRLEVLTGKTIQGDPLPMQLSGSRNHE